MCFVSLFVCLSVCLFLKRCIFVFFYYVYVYVDLNNDNHGRIVAESKYRCLWKPKEGIGSPLQVVVSRLCS